MKKNTYKIIIICALVIAFGYGLMADTDGKLTVSTTTSTAGGQFTPRNIVSIWIEDASGNFVKTLMVYSKFYTTYLSKWKASTLKAGSQYNSVDAITGATKTAYGKLDCYWNGKDYKGNSMPDGKYKVWMELTDKNATGNSTSFEFTKGAVIDNPSYHTVPSFTSNSIKWEPSSSSVVDKSKTYFKVFPNPTSGIVNISGDNFTEVEVRDMNGKLIYHGTERTINLSNKPIGTYFVKISNGENAEVKKIVKE
ncbi:MAG: DUF2271 domain-containing protein [bacterium]